MTKEYYEKIIEGCTTKKQVLKALDKAGIKYTYSDSVDVEDKKYLSIWVEPTIRIYNGVVDYKRFIVQVWEKATIQYSGIPTFFG